MKAYLINMHLLVPRSRSCTKVKVKYKGYISEKKAVSAAFVFHKHILLYFNFMNEPCYLKKDCDGSVKIIGPCHAVQFAYAGMGQNL